MSEVVSTTSTGIFTGLLDIYVAKLTSKDEPGVKPVYDEPRVLGCGIEVTITPSYQSGELNASNRTIRRARRLNSYTLKLNPEALTPEAANYVLDRKKDANGVQIVSGAIQEPPCFAVGIARTKDNGARELWWMYKAVFDETEVSGKTEESGSIAYQTPSINAVCYRRNSDGSLATIADSDDNAIPASVISGWFNAVYEPSDTKAGS